jgi:HSP20 family protein
LRILLVCFIFAPLIMSKGNASLDKIKTPPVSHKRVTPNRNHWAPNTDVYVTGHQLVVKVELAGMRREDLELSIEDNRLLISGQRPDGCRVAKCTFLVMEINYGSFERVIEIPPGYDLTRAKAAYQNGFLRVDVPPSSPSSTGSSSPLCGNGFMAVRHLGNHPGPLSKRFSCLHHSAAERPRLFWVMISPFGSPTTPPPRSSPAILILGDLGERTVAGGLRVALIDWGLGRSGRGPRVS